MQRKSNPGGVGEKSTSGGDSNSRKGKPRYLQLKQPKDIMMYVQTLINQLHRDEKDLAELGKVSQLLNNWIMAYKAQVETNDYKKLREELDAFKAEQARQ